MSMDKIKLFASLDENNVVENYSGVSYSHRIVEYAQSDEIFTRNTPSIGAIFDESLNAFIPPKAPWEDDTWTFNTELLVWDPNPNVVYYHIDNIPHKWNPETRSFYIYEEPPAE